MNTLEPVHNLLEFTVTVLHSVQYIIFFWALVYTVGWLNLGAV